MSHSEMDELYELYVMGVLEPEASAEIHTHLDRACEHCTSRVMELSALLGILGTLVEPVEPPAALKERVLSLVEKKPVIASRKRSGWPVAFSLAAAAAVALLFWGLNEHNSLGSTMRQLHEVSRQRNELRAVVAILSEADTRTVKFGETQSEPHGRVFVSRSGGVVFLGSQLPSLSPGKTFEFWLVPAKGNPRPAGLFSSNAQGISVNVLSQSINPDLFAAVAVSIEPDGGSPQPSSKPILVVSLA